MTIDEECLTDEEKVLVVVVARIVLGETEPSRPLSFCERMDAISALICFSYSRIEAGNVFWKTLKEVDTPYHTDQFY